MKAKIIDFLELKQENCFSAEHYITNRCLTHHRDKLRIDAINRIIIEEKEHIKNLRKEKKLLEEK